VTEIEIKTEDPAHQFESILSIGRGGSIEVNESNFRFVGSVAIELGNLELYFSVHELIDGKVTGPVSAFCEQFKDWVFTDDLSDEAIDFLAVRFFEFENSFRNSLPFSILSQILSHPSLRVESEDWLFEFIISQIESKSNYVGLLEFVRFEYLTRTRIDKFIEWSFVHFDELEMRIPLWLAITKRLSGTAIVDVAKSSRYARPSRVREGSPLDGIIAELTRRHGGNVHARGIVTVSASSVYSSSYPVQNAVDFDQQTIFHSTSALNQWLCYDFKARRIELTDYSIAADPGYLLRCWIVEGSDDGSSWTVLDERKDNRDADSNHPIATFSVEGRMKCRYLRLRQTGRCANNSDYLVLYGFEVFGAITE
jgi:hypothetical protein